MEMLRFQLQYFQLKNNKVFVWNKIDSTNIDSTNGNDQTYHGTTIRTEIEKSIELGMALK